MGGGPVGPALALDPAHRGVDFALVEAGDGRIAHPKVSVEVQYAPDRVFHGPSRLTRSC